VSEQKKFLDYCIGHCKRLRELHVNLEKAVNEIGVRCLPYPGKSSTIGEIIAWFDKEIQALLNAIVKANKIFFCLLSCWSYEHALQECEVPPS
jgi:hypothetical protein